MKIFIVLIFSAIISGCAPQFKSLNDTFQQPEKTIYPETGILIVHTSTTQDFPTFPDGVIHLVYKPYSVFLADGTLLMEVSRSYDKPREVSLKEGSYVIIAEMHKGEKEIFEVVIESGKFTEIKADMFASVNFN